MFQPLRRDFFAASDTPAPFPCFQPGQGGLDPAAFALAPALCRLRHRLLLHGIHPAEAPNRILLKRYRCTGFCRDAVFFIEGSKPVEQALADFVIGHGAANFAKEIVPVKKPPGQLAS